MSIYDKMKKRSDDMMNQLKYDKDFNEIYEEIDCFSSVFEMDEKVRNFIEEKSSSFIIEDFTDEKKYCSNCLSPLNDLKVCPNCNQKLNPKKILYESIWNVKHIKDVLSFSFFMFDIKDSKVLLYLITKYLDYTNPYYCRKQESFLMETYEIQKDKVVNLKTGEQEYYQDYEDKAIKKEEDSSRILSKNFYNPDLTFLYKENLELLEKTNLYRYTNIATFLNNTNQYNLLTLVFYPLYCPQFEFLVKMGLYHLAESCPYKINYKKDALERDLLKFWKKENITEKEYLALKMVPTKKKEILNFISYDLTVTKYLSKIISFPRLINYFKSQKLKKEEIESYFDYIKYSEKLKLNLKDHHILYPDSFKETFNKRLCEFYLLIDEHINEKIKSLAETLSINSYEDDTYLIFPATSVESLIEESSQMSNCVRSYAKKYSENELQIYFMREKKNPTKSLVTIHVENKKIYEAYEKFNTPVSKEREKILKEWESHLIPILNS